MRACIAIALLGIVVATPAASQQRIICSGPDDATCPPPCRRDLSEYYGLIVYGHLPPNTEGLYMGPTVSPLITRESILISADVPARYLEATKHHEACHAAMAHATGSHVYHR